MRTLTYEFSRRSVPVLLDVCLPDEVQAEPLPIFLWWHGGGLIQGSRQSMAPHLQRAADKYNIAVVTTDYRLAPQVRVPEIQLDMTDCLSFVIEKLPAALAERAERAKVDVSRIVLSGSSAGGWQALMLGLGMCPEASSAHLSKVKGIAAIYPITTMDHFFFSEKQTPFGGRITDSADTFARYRDPESQTMSNTMTEEPRKKFYMHAQQEALFPSLLFSEKQRAEGWLKKTDVARFIQDATLAQREAFPSVYIVHGAKDTAVHVDQARKVADALSSVKASIIYDELPDKDHLWDSFEADESMSNLWDFTLHKFAKASKASM